MFDDLIFDTLIFDTQEIEVMQRVYPTKFVIHDLPRILISQIKQLSVTSGKTGSVDPVISPIDAPTRPITKTRRNGHIFSE